jgi:hypothetical protein
VRLESPTKSSACGRIFRGDPDPTEARLICKSFAPLVNLEKVTPYGP